MNDLTETIAEALWDQAERECGWEMPWSAAHKILGGRRVTEFRARAAAVAEALGQWEAAEIASLRAVIVEAREALDGVTAWIGYAGAGCEEASTRCYAALARIAALDVPATLASLKARGIEPNMPSDELMALMRDVPAQQETDR